MEKKSNSRILFKIEKIFTLILMIFIFNSGIYAQNESRLYITEPVKLERDYNSLLSGYLSKLFDANAFLSYGIIGFMSAHHRTHKIDLYNSFLSYSTMLYAVKNKTGFEYEELLVDELKPAVFNNKAIFKNLYTSIIPFYKQYFSKMTSYEQELMLDFFKEGIKYAKEFNITKENADLEKYGPAFLAMKGDLKAFIFRRITAGELTQKECIYWLERIRKDLKSAILPKNRREQQYIIGEQIAGPYYKAFRLDDSDEKVIPEPIFRNNNGWELILPEFAIILDSEYLFEYDQNIRALFAFYQGGKKELLVFHANNADTEKIFQRFEINGVQGDSRTDSRRMSLFQYNNFPPDLFCLKYDKLGNTSIVKFTLDHLPKLDTFSDEESLYSENFKMSSDFLLIYNDESALLYYFSDTVNMKLEQIEIKEYISRVICYPEEKSMLIQYNDLQTEFIISYQNKPIRILLPNARYIGFELRGNNYILEIDKNKNKKENAKLIISESGEILQSGN